MRILSVVMMEIRPMKRAANLSVDSELLDQAKELKINLSHTFENALRTLIRQKQSEQWKIENKQAFDSYGKHIKKHGTFSDKLRSF